MGLAGDDAVTADVSVGVVRRISAAARVSTVLSALQMSAATHVLVAGVHFAAATAVRRVLVNFRTAATAGLFAVLQWAQRFVRVTAEMRARVVRLDAAAAGVFGRQRLDASAAFAGPTVVDRSVAAARV